MAYFSESDINEAKRRVKEMQSRADSFVGDNGNSRQSNGVNDEKPPSPAAIKNENNNTPSPAANTGSDLFSGDKSQLLILALIFILSREGADNQLLLALLYLLF